jgi:hypothetical protein
MVSHAWKGLPHEEREEWEEIARRDKARYEMEKTMYSGPWKVPATKRPQKDPNAPKRPMSAFLSFSNSKRGKVKKDHSAIGNAEVSRILSQMWKDAPEEDRTFHIDQEFKLRQTYKVAIAEWRKHSESEMDATRKAREEEAMKAVLEGKEGINTADYGKAKREQYDDPHAYQNHYPLPGSHWHAGGTVQPPHYANTNHEQNPNSAQPYYQPPYYYPNTTNNNNVHHPNSIQPYYYPPQQPPYYGHTSYAEPVAPLMDGGPYSHGPYYESRGEPVQDGGYGQSHINDTSYADPGAPLMDGAPYSHGPYYESRGEPVQDGGYGQPYTNDTSYPQPHGGAFIGPTEKDTDLHMRRNCF